MSTRKRRKRVRKKRTRFFCRCPRRAVWVGGIIFALLYMRAFYEFFISPTRFRWRALYGNADYPAGYEIHGTDISYYQGDINWQLLRSDMIKGCPLRSVMIKATEGADKLDDNFNDNFYSAREHGFIRGAYHFWSNHSSARDRTYYFLKQVHLEDGDLPPVLDAEHKPKDQSVEDFQRDVLIRLHTVEDKYHVKPMIYTYYKLKDEYLGTPVFDDYPYWITHYYIEKVTCKGKQKFWQHTDAGKLPGIKGFVDLSVHNGSFHDLEQMTISRQKVT